MIAVTTHSHAKGWCQALQMLRAGRLIERELKDTPGCLRHENVVAGRREFWTLTIWGEDADLRACMRSGTHGRIMERQPYWLDSYWGMRWRPGIEQSGGWKGKPWPAEVAPEPSGLGADGPGAPTAMPSFMQAALGMTVPLDRRQVAGAAGATYRLRVPPWAFPAALRDLRRLRNAASSDEGSLRLALGLSTAGALCLLVVAASVGALERVRTSPEHARVLERWGDRAWWSTWEPESEFGHWERHRLRDGQLAGEPLLVDARLPVRSVAARDARAALEEGLRDLDPDTLAILKLLTSELVANDVEHASLAETDSIALRARRKAGWVRVEVDDRGARFEPRVPLAKPSQDESGWGLFIVNHAADRWGVINHPGSRQLWFELRVPFAARDGAGSDAMAGLPAPAAGAEG